MIEPDAEDEELTALALSMAVESYAKMLACKKILQALERGRKKHRSANNSHKIQIPYIV